MISLLLVGLISFFACLVLTPPLRRSLQVLGFVDRHESRSSRRGQIPRMGGLAVLVAAGLGLFAPLLFHTEASKGLLQMVPMLRQLGLPVLLVLGLGVLDDAFGVSPLFKVLVQTGAASLLYLRGIAIHELFGYTLPGWLAIGVTVAWVLGCTNAFNLIDGLDGLAAGVAVFACGTVLAHALMSHLIPLALLTVALTASLAAFLHFNFFPASIFLGDAGSLPIGFLLGAFGLLWMDKATTFVGVTAPLFSLIIPLFDTGLAITRRWLAGNPIFGRDQGHLHHMLVRRGFSVHRSVLLLYCVAGLGAVTSLLLTNFRQQQFTGIVILVFVTLGWSGVQQLGYAEFSEAARLWRRGLFEQRKLVRAHVALRAHAAAIETAQSYEEIWAEVLKFARSQRFTAVDLIVGNPQQPFWSRNAFFADPSDGNMANPTLPQQPRLMPAGWSIRLPLGAAGELGLLSLWRDYQETHPLSTAHLAEMLPRVLAARLQLLLRQNPETQNLTSHTESILADV